MNFSSCRDILRLGSVCPCGVCARACVCARGRVCACACVRVCVCARVRVARARACARARVRARVCARARVRARARARARACSRATLQTSVCVHFALFILRISAEIVQNIFMVKERGAPGRANKRGARAPPPPPPFIHGNFRVSLTSTAA